MHAVSPFNDPAEWSAASAGPEPYREALIDILREAASHWRGNLPRTIQEFSLVVATVALSAIRDAAKEGRDLLGECELLERQGKPAAVAVAASDDDQSKMGVARILAELLYAGNTRLLAQCYDVAGGFGIQGISMQAIADEHGISRADVSKICVELTETYGLPPSPAMRPQRNREVCRQRELQKPTKPRQQWGHFQKLQAV